MIGPERTWAHEEATPAFSIFVAVEWVRFVKTARESSPEETKAVADTLLLTLYRSVPTSRPNLASAMISRAPKTAQRKGYSQPIYKITASNYMTSHYVGTFKAHNISSWAYVRTEGSSYTRVQAKLFKYHTGSLCPLHSALRSFMHTQSQLCLKLLTKSKILWKAE